MRSKGGLALVAALIVLLVTPMPAQGAATRAEYVAQAEPICKSADGAMRRDLKAMNRRWKKKFARSKNSPLGFGQDGEFTKAEEKKLGQLFFNFFIAAVGIGNKEFERVTAQLRPIPPPAGDEVVISTWLAGRTEASRLLFIAVRAGKHRKFKKFARNAFAASDALNQGQTAVNAYGFQHCFLEPEPGNINIPIAPIFEPSGRASGALRAAQAQDIGS